MQILFATKDANVTEFGSCSQMSASSRIEKKLGDSVHKVGVLSTGGRYYFATLHCQVTFAA